ncbi:c-type cytochrome [Paraburkholderia sp. NMBU_R16]|uniref:c-type cytochrome n=1 Tax=Paraburkholderia sp. NMBU_R16 TaxID=2698676 RepID=UPI001564A41F|nr:c-type cytochrome [Paraburkholderia sp. NMBU_R16]NRO97492.1 c-type cytochrome [Paraburkholderia sp. NMBU_R16]
MSAPALAQEGARMAAQLCAACHGVHGDSQSPMFPKLNGQTHDYLVAQLKGFRQHVRGESDARAYMWAIASQLDDATVASLADYYSQQSPTVGGAGDAALIAEGQDIFEHGLPDKGVPACASCHGAHAEGNGQFPRLGGQHADYLMRQIEVFQNGTRANAPVMSAVAHTLSKKDAKAVTTFLQSR